MAKFFGVETGHGIEVPHVLIHQAQEGVDIYVPESQFDHVSQVIAAEKREYSIVSDQEHDIERVFPEGQGRRYVRIEYIEGIQLPLGRGEKITLKRIPPLWKVG